MMFLHAFGSYKYARYVPTDEFGVADACSIMERLQQRMGDVEVLLEMTDAIPRGPNGKFRAVISKVNPGPSDAAKP